MDHAEQENKRFLLFAETVKCFEEYENVVSNNINDENILQYQNECLRMVNELISCQLPESYSTALFYVREELLDQIQSIEKSKEQITLDQITITRTSNPAQESLIPSLQKIFDTTSKFEAKKGKPSDPIDGAVVKLRDTIQKTLVVPQSSGLAEIAGLQEAKNLLIEAVVFPIQYPQLFTEGINKWNKALLYGPPGTGKTFLAHCLAAEVKAPLYSVSNSDLWSSYVGESEKLVQMLFKHGQENPQQCLIFIDEIDSICRVRNTRESELERRFKNQLLTQLSEMDRNPENKIFFLACTNCPWDLDPAFIRRFQRRIYVPLPDREARLEILRIRIKSSELFCSKNWDEILDRTEGWSGSDISDLINCAMLQPIKEIQTADHWMVTDDKFFMPAKNSERTLKVSINEIPSDKVRARCVEVQDFLKAFKYVSKTVSPESLQQFEKFNETYGSLKM